MQRLRMWEGISGFPRREESVYDTFGTAHFEHLDKRCVALAIASRLFRRQAAVVAIIGDGAMSAGMAYEALKRRAAPPTCWSF